MSTNHLRRSLLVIGFFGGLLLVGGVAAAETGTANELDPVVTDVIEMLQAGVDEGVVVQWLESTGRQPSDIGSAGLIALTEAGASEELITALLQGVQRTRQGAATEKAPAVAPPLGAAAAGASSASPVAPSSGSAAAASVDIVASLTAKRVWAEESSPDEPRQEPWDIFLYLDGELLAWTRPSLDGDPVEVRRVVDAGRRELRVVLQRYEELRHGWSYDSLSVPTLVEFEARAGEPIEIDVEMVRIWGLWRQRDDGGPLRYSIRQGARTLAEQGGTGGDPDRWQPICEDVEANFAGSTKVPGRYRNPMSRCVRWSELWTGPGSEISRAALLGELAQYDFEPPIP